MFLKHLISCKESTCNAEDLFDPWVGEIPWRRESLPTPVYWTGEFHGLYSPLDLKESDMTEWLSLSPHKSLKERPTLEWMWIFTTDLGYIKSTGSHKNGVLQIVRFLENSQRFIETKWTLNQKKTSSKTIEKFICMFNFPHILLVWSQSWSCSGSPLVPSSLS